MENNYILFISKNRQRRLKFTQSWNLVLCFLLSYRSHASAPTGAKRSYDFFPSFFERLNFKGYERFFKKIPIVSYTILYNPSDLFRLASYTPWPKVLWLVD